MNVKSSSILVVDDEELNAEGLARRLQRYGHTVTVARSGRTAIELLGDRRFDLVLLDIMMPGINGLEVLKLVRRMDSLIDLPIILVTAKGESEDIVEGLELGANDYVTKPLDFRVVLARIRTQLALRQSVVHVTELEQKLDARNKELEITAAKLAEVNECMRRDLEAAARIQHAFLPAVLPQVPNARFAWTLRPCGQLAGDLVNVFPVGDRHLGLCIIDAKAHGVTAALLSVTASRLLARLSGPGPSPSQWSVLGCCGASSSVTEKEAVVPPAKAVRELSKQFSGEASADQTFTLLYGLLDLDTREFRFVSAGHPGPVHLPSKSRPVVLPGDGLPIGVGMAKYAEQVVELQPGDRLLLYSDGMTDARNAEGEHFGIERLLGALEQTRQLPLEQWLNSMVEKVQAWSGGTPRNDDLSMLAAEITVAE